jgi:hemoglobin
MSVMSTRVAQWALALSLMLAVATACHRTGSDAPPPPVTLYDRLGGEAGLNAVLDDFIANVGADDRIAKYFADTNLPRFKKRLGEQLCAAAGGPCAYTGQQMRAAHPPSMGVTEAAFNALIEDLVRSLNKFKVPAKEQAELLGLLDPMKPDIVSKS